MPPTLLEEIAEGTGPLPVLGDKVVCHYSGFLAAPPQKKFDCSRSRGHAMTFAVGVGKVIDGWDSAIREMSKGARRRVLIPAAEAYGSKGQPPTIPPNADLIFDIELLAVNETLVAEGMRIRREEAERADKFIREQDALRAAEAARHQQQPAPPPEGPRRGGGGCSSSGSGSDSDSSDSSDNARRHDKKRKREKEERKHHRKREKHSSSKREKSSSKHKKKEREKKEKRRHDKKDKRHRRDRDEGAHAAVEPAAPKWGAYGIIREGDMHEKQEEFLAWLSEVKGVPQAACGRRELQEHFGSFVEDYNTATMPSEKYYDMRVWYNKEQERIRREGASADDGVAGVERTKFDDEGERKAEVQRERAQREHARTMLMAKSMHGASHLVEDMRAQEQQRLKAQQAYQTGDEKTAREIAQKLDPKYVSAEELRATFGGPAALNSKKPGGMNGGKK